MLGGTISEIHNFGVFVRLERDPPGSPGTGFIRIPELTWEYFCDPADVGTPANRSPPSCSTSTPPVHRWTAPRLDGERAP